MYGVKTMVGKAGENPGNGRYECQNCGWEVRIRDVGDKLPHCGRCSNGDETKYALVHNTPKHESLTG